MNEAYELLKVFSPILAALISGYCLLLSQRTKKLEVKLLQAYKDVRFYQAVESVHVEMEIGRSEVDNKKKVRAIVRKEIGLDNSGLAPSQIDRAIERIKGFSLL